MIDQGAVVGILLLVLLIVWVVRSVQFYRRVNALVARLKQEGALLCLSTWELRGQWTQIGKAETRWRPGVLAIMPDGLVFYPRTPKMEAHIRCKATALRWFGRPVKYHSGTNEMWLHFEQADGWHLLKVGTDRYTMARLVRAVKQIATDEQIRAYRRRRPYVHYGPILAAPADQDIHGAWVLEQAVMLYLTPSHLAILRAEQVLRTLPLAHIQQIGALRRVDVPEADGLVRFQVEGEKFAFALPAYEAFAQALAEAARRTLEDPILRKQKARDDDYDYEEEDIEDLQDFMLGEDGEIIPKRGHSG